MARATLLLPVACVLAAPLLVTLALQLGHDPRRAEAARTLHARDKDYVGASTCRDCHLDRFASWRRTYHSTMTQLPTRTSVLGRFDGNTVTLFGASATPVEREGRFYFQLPAYAGQGPREAEVALLVGSRRYQQYFERTEDAEGITYRRLPLLWHVGERRWMHLNGIFLEPDSDNWAAHRSVWNANCIFCHNTGVVPGLTPQEDGSKRLDSHVADLGIACESCHGPGREHARSKASLASRYRAQLGLTPPANDIVDPLRLGQAESAALCGQCHSQRVPDPLEKLWTYLDTGPTFRPGGVLAGHVKPVDRDTPSGDPHQPNAFRERFWNDGTARLTAYEYLGLTQSPCFKDTRFTCGSCHTMHGGDVAGQLEPEMRGDRACTQCHGAIAQNLTAHTHHRPESSGSRCLDCHMPRMVYGILTIHRSHRVESPDVQRDVEAGRPNACTACHLTRTAGWAAAKMREWWGPRYADPRSRPNGAPLDIAEALGSLHAGDPVQRAVYFSALSRGVEARADPGAGGALLAHALVGLGDGYPAIRTLARQAALAQEGALGLGLQEQLRAYDPQAPRVERDRDLLALFRELETTAPHRLAPPEEGMLLGKDYRLDRARIRTLLGLQSGQEISIGE
jgi:predicted CXXCH cytochrome family protein